MVRWDRGGEADGETDSGADILGRTGLPVVLQLLQGEDVFVEVLLQLFVGVVDVELLEAVDLDRKRITALR